MVVLKCLLSGNIYWDFTILMSLMCKLIIIIRPVWNMFWSAVGALRLLATIASQRAACFSCCGVGRGESKVIAGRGSFDKLCWA